MFKVIKNNVALDLMEGAQIDVVEGNPLFLDEIQTPVAYNVALAKSPRNLKELGLFHLPEVLETTEFEVLVERGANVYDAILSINSMDDAINGTVVFGGVDLKVLGKALPEIDYSIEEGKLPTTMQGQWEMATQQQWPEAVFYMPPIIMQEFYDSIDSADKRNPMWRGVVNQGFYVNNVYEYFENSVTRATDEGLIYNALVPQWPVLMLLEAGFRQDGYRLIGALKDTDLLRKCFLFSNRAIDTPEPIAAVLSGNGWQQTPQAVTASATPIPQTGIRFTDTDNPVLFINGNRVDPGSAGRYRVKIEFELDQAVSPRLAENERIRLVEYIGPTNATRVYIDEPVTYTNGGFTIEQSITVPSLVAPLFIQLTNPNSQFRYIKNFRWEFQRQARELPYLLFEPIQKFKDYLPLIKFGDLFQAFLDSLLLYPVINTIEKTIDLRPRKIQERNTVRELGPHEVEGRNLSIDDMEPITIEWKVPGEWEEKEAPGVMYRTRVRIDKGQMQILSARPENEDIFTINQSPLVDSAFFEAGILRDQTFQTSEVRGQGYLPAVELTNELKDIRFGFFIPLSAVAPLSRSWHAGFSFAWTLQFGSIARQYSIWYAWFYANRRTYEIEVDPNYPNLEQVQPTDVLKGQQTPWMIVEKNYTYNENGIERAAFKVKKW